MSIFALKIAAKLHKKPEISIIICSHNRANNLNEVLPYYAQLNAKIPHEIVVVLNACTDNSIDIVKIQQEQNSQIRFVFEEVVGASNARNRGWKESLADFVFYIDDDAFPVSSLLEDIKDVLINETVVSFTGRTLYWRKNDPMWIKNTYVEMPLLSETQMVMHTKGHINGCACGFKKEILEEVGGFHTDLDMKGKKIGYGVEEYIRLEILKAGYPTIYCPNIKVWHQSHSKTVNDFLKSS
ncbi:MAG: glycosyltransferase family 2 protein, partial [Bacteroidia bacterium]|nr:glycosyltransferase family 2 protein [Bacteroidia bacterium]